MYKVGDSLEVKITNIVDYGAFVRDEDGTKGLIHISEISNHYVSNINDHLSVGQIVEVSILDYNPEKDQLKLSYKALNEVDYKPRNFESDHEFKALEKHRDSKIEETKERLGIKND